MFSNIEAWLIYSSVPNSALSPAAKRIGEV